ncbi:hypothetical protein HPP92_017880 [Vanilla planifolia]|uniref:Uncharacterized protein n=1 Tax=Vanilla planifolia TaxID=51239 RepID=A0A835QIV8_VANPL|nr:hypothetical protein HPP92_017880 [Vanilla planifolia]
MVRMKVSCAFGALLFLNLIIFPVHGTNTLPMDQDDDSPKIYIVHLLKPISKKFHHFKDRKEWYMSYLPNATLASGEPRLVYSYRQVITGFAAWLSPEDVIAMKTMDGFLFARLDTKVQPRTTHSYEFLGLDRNSGLWYDSEYGSGLIIGVIDTGIKSTHPSFRGRGLPPYDPNKWKGRCYWGPPICNNKLIGAQGFNGGRTIPPVDDEGHGTHVSGIAAGNFVDDASLLGTGSGTATGIAPKAHLAMYKISSAGDLLKAIEEAIRNQVDVISISQGDDKPAFMLNGIVIGAFAAAKKGIVTCAAAPNSGPVPSVIDNDAPWMITVGASTTDRRITAIVKLGNNREFIGESAYQPNGYSSPELPLVNAAYCSNLKRYNVVGKIVVCYTSINNTKLGENVQKAGGLAMIVTSGFGNLTSPEPHVLPASHVTTQDGNEIKKYISASSNATASIIFKGTELGIRPAPVIAVFSGRGPSLTNGGLISPDIVAPGVNILSAWPWELGPNQTGTPKTFLYQSGTSMATPHVAGVATLLKHKYPTWSIAAIQSAIMTTAQFKDRDGNPITDQSGGKKAGVFQMGSGHLDPVAASDPGLIYDINFHDYIRYLCGSGLFSSQDVSAIVQGKINCSNIRGIKPEELNYPSIGVTLSASSPTVTVTRTVTNVGDTDTTYTVDFVEPEGVRIDVSPVTLDFKNVGEMKSYNVTISFKSTPMPPGDYSEGHLAWDSGKYFVRSPIAVTFV